MSQDCIVGVYENAAGAEKAIRELKKEGFPEGQISFVTRRVEDQMDDPDAVQSNDEGEKKTALGATTGGLLGLLAGAPLLAIPGVGPALVGGQLAAGLTGAVVGGFLGGMSGWGVQEDYLPRYQEYVDQDHVLVIARGDPLQVADAQRILQDTQTVELNLHADPSADASDEDVMPTNNDEESD